MPWVIRKGLPECGPVQLLGPWPVGGLHRWLLTFRRFLHIPIVYLVDAAAEACDACGTTRFHCGGL